MPYIFAEKRGFPPIHSHPSAQHSPLKNILCNISCDIPIEILCGPSHLSVWSGSYKFWAWGIFHTGIVYRIAQLPWI
jgi:hypothetical protein